MRRGLFSLRHLGYGLLLCAITMATVFFGAPAFAAPPAQNERVLRVVTKPLAPFVMKNGSAWQGFSIDLWERIAQELNLKYEWVEVATVTDQLDAVRSGTADVAIAGISMTREREQLVDFSHPYFNSGLQIMVSGTANHSIVDVLSHLVSPALLEILGIAFLFLLIMAHIILLTERGLNANMPKSYLPGIWEALWWSLSTIGTLEYGDRTKPKSAWHRLFAMFWIALSIILIAQFTASITASLTVQQLTGTINGPNDLPGKRIATVRGSTGAKYLDALHQSYTPVERIEDAYALLENDSVQAIVYDAPVLLYYASTAGKGKVETVGATFQEETYGIALPIGSPLRKQINEALLTLKQDGTYDTLYQKWFGEK